MWGFLAYPIGDLVHRGLAAPVVAGVLAVLAVFALVAWLVSDFVGGDKPSPSSSSSPAAEVPGGASNASNASTPTRACRCQRPSKLAG